MELLRQLLVQFLGLLLALPLALLSCFRLLLKKGSLNWPKARPLPPSTLTDSKWGQHHYVHLPNLKMHYVAKGDCDKPLMLFLHGFPEFWFSFRHQLVDFSDKFYCVAPDMRGYGDSERPTGKEHYSVAQLVEDVHQLILALNKDKCVLVAHDWGGAVGYAFCQAHPDMVSHYVALNIPHPKALFQAMSKGWKQIMMSWYILMFQCPFIPDRILLRLDDLGLFNRFFKDLNLEKDCQEIEAYKFTYRDAAAFTGPLNYYRNAIQSAPREDRGDKVKVPVLCVFGTADIALSVESAQLSGNFIEDYELELLEGISHWVQMQAPDEVNRKIRDYLNARGIKA